MTKIPIPNLAIGGYRSFGEIQYFESFSKINLFIGRNNSGKSNVLRFLKEIYSLDIKKGELKNNPLVRHLPDMPPLVVGIRAEIPRDDSEETRVKFFPVPRRNGNYIAEINTIRKIFEEKARLDKKAHCWTIVKIPEMNHELGSWRNAMSNINDREIYLLWSAMVQMTDGSRNRWEEDIVRILPASISTVEVDVHLIPAIRQIGKKGSLFESEYDGTGIIDRLARLQNPDVLNQADRKKFEEITAFVRSVLDRNDAKIEIPYERDTILLHMDNKVLPLDSLGTGVHEVVILAAAATILSDTVLCIEEPELHLNPILQRKLMRYLSEYTSNQYFITTHSPSIMDTVGAEVYHIVYEDGASKVYRASSDSHKSTACEDLGYHPSDLLQANCVIWVEGPSDRIYLNYWLHDRASNLIEGIHYSIMFYGGRLLSHLSYSDSENDSSINDFISLRRLNRRGIIVIDSDRAEAKAPINETKTRLCEEFEKGGYAWVSDGREIENYIPKEQLETAIQAVHPEATILSSFRQYANNLKIKGGRKGNESQADKVKIAKEVTKNIPPDFKQLDLEKRILEVIKYIEESNPSASIS